MSYASDLKIKLLIDRYRPFLLPFIFILFVIFSLSDIVMPRVNVIADSWQEMQETKKTVESLNTKLVFLRSLDEKELKNNYDFLLQVLPEDREPFYSLAVLEWLGTRNGLTIERATFEPGEISTKSALPKGTKKDYDTMSYDLNVRGNLEELKGFLVELEKIVPVSSTDSLSLELRSGRVLGTNLLIEMYSALLPAKIGRPSDPISDLDESEKKLLDKLRADLILPETNTNFLTSDPLGKNNPFD